MNETQGSGGTSSARWSRRVRGRLIRRTGPMNIAPMHDAVLADAAARALSAPATPVRHERVARAQAMVADPAFDLDGSFARAMEVAIRRELDNA